jgi:PPK2 family polyphosphate:nucleotide phosphotransferase
MPVTTIDEFRVKPGSRFKLADYDPEWAGDTSVPKKDRIAQAASLLSQDVSRLAEAQDRLYAADSWSILAIFQAMDAAGKDGTIKHVMSGINPQGCQVFSFKQPSPEDLDHNFLWRYSRCLPERGRIGVFNRSYYEEVLVVKVHPEWITRQRIPDADPEKKSLWNDRYHDINEFEHHLSRNGTRIVKFFLNVSKDEQRRRFLKRLNKPDKFWKFSPNDIAERGFWDAYMNAYQDALAATSTEWAPWYVIPADHKWVTRAVVSAILTRTIDDLGVQYPSVPPEQLERFSAHRQALEAEHGHDAKPRTRTKAKPKTP